jgi:DNA invertase Pin-like site-specific DNA recombinase
MAGERVAFLLRESDARNAEAALASQKRALELDAEQQGDEVVATYADAGYSGAILDRPAIEDLLADAGRGRFTVVRATELGRLSRGEAASFYFIKAELARHGVRLEFLDNQFVDDGESEAGAIVEGLQVLLPSIERRAIARRFKRGRDRVADEGFTWSSRPPYGYTYVKGGQRGGGHWEIHPEESAWVKQIFAWAAEGVSMGEIARRLVRDGVPTQHGGTWWAPTISQILANPKYYGCFASGRYQATTARREYRPRKGAPAVGKPGRKRRQTKSSAALRPEAEWKGKTMRADLALVDEATWRRANAQRERNKQLSPRNAREPGLLHGLVYCGRAHRNGCEHRMKLKYRANGTPFWRCPERAGPGGPYCRGRMLAAALEQAVWAKVVSFLTSPEEYLADLRARFAEARAVIERRQRRKAAAAAALCTAHLALDNLERARLRGEVDGAQYARRRPRLLDDERTAQEELAQVEQELITDAPLRQCWTYQGGEYKRITILPVALLDVEHMDAEQRQRTVRQFVERVVIDESGAYLVGLVPSASGLLPIHDIDHDRGPLPRCLKARFKMASTSWAVSTISLRSLHAP